jgi:hypothetical protein
VSEHHCHAVGCAVKVPPSMHMCAPHWRMVPEPIKRLIWKRYRPGQEIDKRPSLDYVATAFVSISCVALLEGKPLPSLQAASEQAEQKGPNA